MGPNGKAPTVAELQPPYAAASGPAPDADDLVQAAIQGIVTDLLAGRPEQAAEWFEGLQLPRRLAVGGRPLAAKEQWRLFRRDGFTCRYCAKQTIFVPVLRILSRTYPQQLPFHPHWRWEATHPVYWTHGCSLDHLIPVSRGGTTTVANLVTTCYQCNSIKQHWLLEELRWTLLPPPQADCRWDGLSGSYLQLCELLGTGGEKYHYDWNRALHAAK